MLHLKKYFLSTFFILQLIFLGIIKNYPDVVEKYYSNFIYQKIAVLNRKIFGYFSFSVGDLIYMVLIFLIFRWIFSIKKTWKTNYKFHLFTVINFVSVFYFLFHLLWGLNYYRVPLQKKMNLKTEYLLEDLESFTDRLITETNIIHEKITKNVNQKVIISATNETIFRNNVLGYEALSKEYAFFTYKHFSVKSSLFSKPLSYMGFAGYLNPFTTEAQVNYEIPKHSKFMTASHEMAHQIGFASESECNFIGYLACVANKNLEANFSANTFCLRYCLAVLKLKKSKQLVAFDQRVNPGIKKNFAESELFWKQHEGFFEGSFKKFYDQFLKLNQQKEGIESYGKFLNLLINYDLVKKKCDTCNI
jgi:Protein of unknown function (DUF3810)